MEGWAPLEPERWSQLRRAVSFISWSLVVSLLGCGAFVAGPMVAVGARIAMRWAPTARARTAAELLLCAALVAWTLLVIAVVAIFAGRPESELNLLGLAVGLGGLVEGVGVVMTLRALAEWSGAEQLIDRWDRSIRLLPVVILVMVFAAIGSVVAPVLVAVAAGCGFWFLWVLGYPVWCTYRVFRAELSSSSPTDPLWRTR